MVKCLVVDDDELGRDLIAHYLKGIAECEMAGNGVKAVEMFRSAFEGGIPYDLIILDIVMPEMDGHTAAKEIRTIEKEWGVSIHKGVNIVVLPGDVMQAYVSARSAAHLVKPVHPDKLLATLSKMGICT
jgi:two-component system, chemotaxis family, chemotaxis protein CheY